MKQAIQYLGQSITPSKVVCVGRNYVDHVKELENVIPTEPVIFVKPNSAISSELVLVADDEVHFEAELAFLIKAGVLVGVGFGLDLTKRQVQNELKSKGLPWERAKAFDQSAVFSEFVPFKGDPEGLRLELYLNDELQQIGGCSMMLFSPNALIDEINSFMTMEDGDVLMTGTPAGVGKIQAEDVFTGKVFAGDQLLLETTWVVLSH